VNGALKLPDALHDAVQAVSRHASRAATAIIMADSPKQYPHDWRDGGAAFGRNFGDCLATGNMISEFAPELKRLGRKLHLPFVPKN